MSKKSKKANKNDKKNGKNKKKKKGFLVFLLILLLVGALCWYLFIYSKPTKKKVRVEIEVLDKLDDYGYSLSDNDSDLYKTEFEKLKEIVNADKFVEEDYVNQVAKLFVIDLYTMSTKTNLYDVGGREFFYADKVEMFEKKVMDSLYSTLLDNTYGDRKQELPEVSSITIESTEKTTYKLGSKSVDGYLIKLKWTYKKDMGYDDEGSIVICKEEEPRWSVVDYQPTLKPEYEK